MESAAVGSGSRFIERLYRHHRSDPLSQQSDVSNLAEGPPQLCQVPETFFFDLERIKDVSTLQSPTTAIAIL